MRDSNNTADSVLRENVWVKSRVDGVFSLEAFQVGGNFFFAGNFEYRRSNELRFGIEFVTVFIYLAVGEKWKFEKPFIFRSKVCNLFN